SAWSFAMKFRVPTGSTSRGELFDSLDSNFNGLAILVNWNGSDNAANIFITCANNVGGCWFYTQAYARDSWYYLAVTYDGSGGAGGVGGGGDWRTLLLCSSPDRHAGDTRDRDGRWRAADALFRQQQQRWFGVHDGTPVARRASWRRDGLRRRLGPERSDYRETE